MRRSAALLCVPLFLLAACAPTDTVNEPVDDTVGREDAAASSVPPTSDARVIEVTATDWEFSPGAITATKGESVIVRLKGGEGAHSFAIEALGINVPISPGETKDIVIPTDTAGTFEFRCRIPCGPGHRDMKGTLVIS